MDKLKQLQDSVKDLKNVEVAVNMPTDPPVGSLLASLGDLSQVATTVPARQDDQLREVETNANVQPAVSKIGIQAPMSSRTVVSDANPVSLAASLGTFPELGAVSQKSSLSAERAVNMLQSLAGLAAAPGSATLTMKSSNLNTAALIDVNGASTGVKRGVPSGHSIALPPLKTPRIAMQSVLHKSIDNPKVPLSQSFIYGAAKTNGSPLNGESQVNKVVARPARSVSPVTNNIVSTLSEAVRYAPARAAQSIPQQQAELSLHDLGVIKAHAKDSIQFFQKAKSELDAQKIGMEVQHQHANQEQTKTSASYRQLTGLANNINGNAGTNQIRNSNSSSSQSAQGVYSQSIHNNRSTAASTLSTSPSRKNEDRLPNNYGNTAYRPTKPHQMKTGSFSASQSSLFPSTAKLFVVKKRLTFSKESWKRPRCKFEQCNRLEREGGYCLMHGGGERCSQAGCTRVARLASRCYTHCPPDIVYRCKAHVTYRNLNSGLPKAVHMTWVPEARMVEPAVAESEGGAEKEKNLVDAPDEGENDENETKETKTKDLTGGRLGVISDVSFTQLLASSGNRKDATRFFDEIHTKSKVQTPERVLPDVTTRRSDMNILHMIYKRMIGNGFQSIMEHIAESPLDESIVEDELFSLPVGWSKVPSESKHKSKLVSPAGKKFNNVQEASLQCVPEPAYEHAMPLEDYFWFFRDHVPSSKQKEWVQSIQAGDTEPTYTVRFTSYASIRKAIGLNACRIKLTTHQYIYTVLPLIVSYSHERETAVFRFVSRKAPFATVPKDLVKMLPPNTTIPTAERLAKPKTARVAKDGDNKKRKKGT